MAKEFFDGLGKLLALVMEFFKFAHGSSESIAIECLGFFSIHPHGILTVRHSRRANDEATVFHCVVEIVSLTLTT
jgi:hypothetical protein